MNKQTKFEITSLEKARDLYKQHINDMKAATLSVVKSTTDRRKIGKAFSQFRGSKKQFLLRDIKKPHCIVHYRPNEIPSRKRLNEILDFVDSLKDLNINLFIVHCRRGVSRSAAIAIGIIAYVHNISIEKAYVMAQQFKLQGIMKSSKITPSNIILSEFKEILKQRKF